MTVSIVRSGSSGFGDLTNDPSFLNVQVDTSGDYIYIGYMFRDAGAAEIDPPTWNGQTFTQLQNIALPTAAPAHRLKLFRLKTSSAGTHDIIASNPEYENTAGFYAVLTGVSATTPEGATQVQQAWDSYANPSLTVTDGASGDLFFEILGAGGYDKDFNDVTTVIWAAANSQTGVINQHSTNAYNGTPNIILSTKAGASGSQALGYTASAGAPGYIHVAFAIKAIIPDTTAPTLSSASGVASGARSAMGSVTTNEANGTLYSVLTTSATQPSVAQIKAGQNHTGVGASYAGNQAITTTGAKLVSAPSGLTPKVAYYWHHVHTDAANNDSARISSAPFTTRGEITDTDGDNVVTNGQTSVAIHGYFGASDPVVRIKSGSISQTQSDVSHNSTTITLSSIARGNLPYTDVNHQHFIEVDTDE